MAVVITGCTRGLGAVLSQELLLRGWPVILTGRGADAEAKCAAIVEDAQLELARRQSIFERDTGLDFVDADALPADLQHTFIELDVTSADSIRSFVDEVRQVTTDLILVNNAAISAPGWTQDAVNTCLDTNVYGVVHLTEQLGRYMDRNSKVWHVLCRQATPRPGGALPREMCKELRSLGMEPSFSRYWKRLRAMASAIDEQDKGMAAQENAAYLYSKAVLYTYAMQSSREFEKRGVYVNGLCPGHMDTGLASFPTDRNPFDACRAFHSAFDSENIDNPFYKQWLVSNKQLPSARLFTSSSLFSLADSIDPDKPVGEGKADPSRSKYSRGVYIAGMAGEPDWRPAVLAEKKKKADAGKGLLAKYFPSFF